MRIVHERDGDIGGGPGDDGDRVLATDVEVAGGTLAHATGLRFRSEVPEDYAFVMEVGDKNPMPFASGPTRNIVDMFFMRTAIDVVWLVDGEVVKTKRMHPWRSLGMAKADTILEFPAGAAEGVQVGDTVRIEGSDGD